MPRSLQRQMRLTCRGAFSQHDALDAVIANDAAPERVVQVQYEALLRQAALRSQHSHCELPVLRSGTRRNLQLALQPRGRVVPRVQSIAFARARDVEQQHALAGGGRRQQLVEAGDEPARGARHLPFEAAEEGLAGIQVGLLYDGRAQGVPRVSPQGGQLLDMCADGSLRLRRRGGQRYTTDEVVSREGQQQGLRRKGVQRRGGVEDFLPILAVLAHIGCDAQALTQTGNADPCRKMVNGRRRKDREAHRRQAGTACGLCRRQRLVEQ